MESYIRSCPYKGILEASFFWSGEDEAPLLLPPPVELLLVSNGEDIIYPSYFLFATVSPLGLLIISKLQKLRLTRQRKGTLSIEFTEAQCMRSGGRGK